jgi:hypothetical protein
MKKTLTLFLMLASLITLQAQPKPFKVSKNANHFVYASYDYDEHIDTQYIQIEIDGGRNYLVTKGDRLPGEYHPGGWNNGPYIQGYSVEDIFVDESKDSITYLTTIFNGDKREHYRTVTPFSRKDIHFDTDQVNGLTRYTCSINSNKLEFYVQPFETIWHGGPKTWGKESRDLSPVPYYGRFHGLLVSFWRNGQCQLQLVKTDRVHSSKFYLNNRYPLVTPRELSNIKRQKMVITTRVFDSVQLCWCDKNDHIEGNYRQNAPYDSVLHYAGGTLALKRIQLPQLPNHYQTFIELHQRSNGDAYDRTGSVFIIPGADIDLCPNFFDGINNHPDSLPLFIGRDGEHYQGIKNGISTLQQYRISSFMYWPPVELMRFFTPFGVGQFNDRVQIDGLDWQDEAYYKQEVTDIAHLLQGEVWIGVWIGNYDRGGHTVTLDLKSYPGEQTVPADNENESQQFYPHSYSLFNTCNVLEMAGQNYGKLFATDSLTTTFTLWESDTTHNVRLRYIATGHGGWGGGDEFNPKTHTILIDGKPAFTHTPWRGDCGRYREWNPVSGNFWNGLSSSDYSRSGWCPGTATQPVYFDLMHYFRTRGLSPVGRHTLTVAIPQGEPQAGNFSHWCISGILLVE